jgi:hypothetical protein
MKLFSFLLSIVVFFASLYFFTLKVPDVNTDNDVIYVALLVILMAICIVGVLINWEFVTRRKNMR